MNSYVIEAKSSDRYDTVVVGAGTSGCFAAIASARGGASTLLIERSFTVGGMITEGNAGLTMFVEHCSNPELYKNEVIDRLKSDPKSVQVVRGLADEFIKRLYKKGGARMTYGEGGSYVYTDRAAAQSTLVEMLDEAGVDLLYDTRVCLSNVKDGRVRSVVVVNKEGFTEIEGGIFIDTTGDGDLAALSGVPYRYGMSEEDLKEVNFPIGGTMLCGVMFKVLGVDFKRLLDFLKSSPKNFFMQEFGIMTLDDVIESYNRGDSCIFRIILDDYPDDYNLVQVYNIPEEGGAVLLGDGCCAKDRQGEYSAGLNAKSLSEGQNFLQKNIYKLMTYINKFPGFEKARVSCIPSVGIRETRHIEGEYVLTALDILKGEKFYDSIAQGAHPCDIHPLPPELEGMKMDHWRFSIPYRCLVAKGVGNLLVGGRCISATRTASGCIRPTAQCMAVGQACGTAAAILKGMPNTAAADIDIAALRAQLIKDGAII